MMRHLGKVDGSYLSRIVYPRLGAARREIIVGPRFGVDNAVMKVGHGKVMVTTTDPLSFIPTLGARESAWLSVNLIASDLATSGFAPQYGVFDFNLPPTMPNREFEDYWRSFHAECKRLGLAIIGGHTGRYPGCDYTIIGGGVMYAFGPESGYLTSQMGEVGDDILLTKGAAIETTAVLSRSFPRTVRRQIGASLFEQARTYLSKVSTVKDSLTAVSVGIHQKGVTSMHDATEGGVLAAVFELANAAGLGAKLDLAAILVSQETEEICNLFQLDPLISLSEGSLIISCKSNKTSRVLAKLKSANIQSTVIGQLEPKRLGVFGDYGNGMRKIEYPKVDPYWKAYWQAKRKRWK